MGKQAILCVDDELVVLTSLKEQLKRYLSKEYYIEVASSGREALAVFEELTADGLNIPLIISDELMPDMKGDELLIEIHRRAPNTLKIMLTGQASANAVGNAVNNANLYRYITKPWDETDLLLTVTEALRCYDQELKLAEQNEALRQVNRELEHLNSSLEQKVSDRTAELRHAKQAAEVANRAKSQFLASMSHELRTPLNAILGFSQILAYETSLTVKQRENISIINRSGEHLLSLINDILDLAKIEAGQLVLNPKNFNLHRLLDDLHEMLQLKATRKGLQFIFDCDPNLPQYIYSDESKLRQVLLNLLGNAIKFTLEGQVILRIRNSALRIQSPPSQKQAIEFSKKGRDFPSPFALPLAESVTVSSPSPASERPKTHILCFEIEDTGQGIAPEEIDNLFDPFVQTETGRQSMEGTGLGLPISQEFVHLMGGEITARSQLGCGSTFSFEIRADSVPETDPPSAARERDVPLKRIVGLAGDRAASILVVEDVEENRQLIVKLLEPLGFQVKVAENGKEALELWQLWQPNLILMDMRMPVMDGYEATQKIKSTPQGRETPIIALTASAFAEEQQVMLASGCDDFICKPFRQEILFAKLADRLNLDYCYEDTLPPHAPHVTDTLHLSRAQTESLQARIQQMPAEWIERLHQAAIEIDDQQVLALVEEIPNAETHLIDSLVDLVNSFRCDLIIELTQMSGRD